MLLDASVVISVSVVWKVLALAIFFAMGGYNDRRITNFGPSEEMYFIGLHINTWPRWSLLMAFVVIDSIVECWGEEIVRNWVASLYDSDAVLKYSRTKTMVLVNLHQNSARWSSLLTLYIYLFTQGDVVLLRLLGAAMTTAVTSWAAFHKRETYEGLTLHGGLFSGGEDVEG
jgi:hypothetical protein